MAPTPNEGETAVAPAAEDEGGDAGLPLPWVAELPTWWMARELRDLDVDLPWLLVEAEGGDINPGMAPEEPPEPPDAPLPYSGD